MAKGHNYRNILAAMMPGELSPDLLDKLVKDIAIMAKKLPPDELSKFLCWYLHGVATSRCFKALSVVEIAEAATEAAFAIVDALQKDIETLVTDNTAA